MIVAGNGSDELLAMLFRATLDPGDRVAWASPTYSLYDTLAAVQEARVIAPPWSADFELPVEALVRARARLTIVCNPNSPSGTLTPRRTLARLARLLDGRLLAIDEAYVDFAEENALGLVRRFPNVLVLRSLSKSYSLAGMRLGLCFAHPEIIDATRQGQGFLQPEPRGDRRWRRGAGRQRLDAAQCRARQAHARRGHRAGCANWASRCRRRRPISCSRGCPGATSVRWRAGLRKRGVLVRYFRAWPDALRISIGTPAEMAALFKALAPLAAALMAARRHGRVRS